MTIRDREVLELLREEPELLAIADAVQTTQLPASRRRGFALRLPVAAAALAALLALALFAPWERGDGGGIVDRALAAVGNGPVFHSVVRFSQGTRVDLRSGREFPVPSEVESWLDEEQKQLRLVFRRDGRVVKRLAGASGERGFGSELFLPSLLADRYRRALEEKQVRVEREGVVRGTRVVWLVSEGERGFVWRAAVDAETYRPLVLQLLVNGEHRFRQDVVVFESVAREETPLAGSTAGWLPIEHGSNVSGSGSAVSGGSSSLAGMRLALGRPLLWPGLRVHGRMLSHVGSGVREATFHLESEDKKYSAFEVALSYGPEPKWLPLRYLTIAQAVASEAASLWRAEGEAAPPPGYLDLERSSVGFADRERTRWHGRLQRNGFYLELDSWSREAVIEAARKLRPVPQSTGKIDRVLAAICTQLERLEGSCR